MEWTRVVDGLPTKTMRVLATLRYDKIPELDRYVTDLVYDEPNKRFVAIDLMFGRELTTISNVIAWAPCPEGYRGD